MEAKTQNLTRFWQSLEELIGCATVAEEWRLITGDQFELARRFLRSSGELATFFPHPDPGICIWRVVTHGPDDHVGVCDETGERIVLTTEDLVIYELDTLALEAALVRAFGFQAKEQARAWHPRDPRRIGHFVPVAGFRFAVYLAIPSPQTGLLPKVCRIVANEQGPFLLLAPTRRRFTEDRDQLLRRQGACFLPLTESVCVGDDGRLVVSEAGQRTIEEFRRRVVPQSQVDGERVFFPTPPGAKWSDVRIRLVDGCNDTLAVPLPSADGWLARRGADHGGSSVIRVLS